MQYVRMGRIGRHFVVPTALLVVFVFGFLGSVQASHIWGPYNYIECDRESMFASAWDRASGWPYEQYAAIIDGDGITNYYYYRDEVRSKFDGDMSVTLAGSVFIDLGKPIDWIWVTSNWGVGGYSIAGGYGYTWVAFTMGGYASWHVVVGTVNYHTSSPTTTVWINANALEASDSDTAYLNTCT